MVCCDLWLASVATAQALNRYNKRFIGVVENGTRQYPMKYLSNMKLTTRGDLVSMVSKSDTDNSKLVALLWMDRERRYFISSCSVTSPGETIERIEWRREGERTKKIQFTSQFQRLLRITTKLVAKVTGTTEIGKIHWIWRRSLRSKNGQCE